MIAFDLKRGAPTRDADRRGPRLRRRRGGRARHARGDDPPARLGPCRRAPGADRQIAVWENTHDLRAVVDFLVDETRRDLVDSPDGLAARLLLGPAATCQLKRTYGKEYCLSECPTLRPRIATTTCASSPRPTCRPRTSAHGGRGHPGHEPRLAQPGPRLASSMPCRTPPATSLPCSSPMGCASRAVSFDACGSAT